MKSIKGTLTEKNLLTSFAGESQARMRYTYFAKEAKREGYEQIAAIFEQTAEQEKMIEINQKLQGALDTVGKEGSYVCIFDLAGGIPFINTTLCDDVTAKVKAKLGIAANAVPAAPAK